MRDVLTTEEAAEYLHVSTDTVYRLIRMRQLAASRSGRSYRIAREEVEAYLLAHGTRPQLRAALIDRVQAIGRRNAEQYPDLTSDDVLAELDAYDAVQRRAPLASQ